MILVEKFLAVGGPDISNSEEQAVLDVLRSGWLGNGPIAKKFEEEFVNSLGIEDFQGLAVNSCTTGLILALKAAGVGEDHEVITTPLTFAATVNAITSVGAWPVFCDVTKDGLIDPLEISKSITPKTRAIIPVHLHGAPCDMDLIMDIAVKNRLVVIEDAAHAYGGTYKNVPCGTIGHYGVFSFYPTKNITTVDGGMVISRKSDKIELMRVMASQGLSEGSWNRYGPGPIKNYEVKAEGLKGLMTDLSAAIGREQLLRWPEMKERRNEVFKIYEKEFGKKPEGHSQHIYSIEVKNRDYVRKRLYEKGIGTGVHYKSLNLEPFMAWDINHYPNAERIGNETISLPMSSTMTKEDAFRVIEAVKNA